MDVQATSYLVGMSAFAIAVTVGCVVALLKLRSEVIKHTKIERRRIRKKLEELGVKESEIRQYVNRLDKSRSVSDNYRKMWQAFLVAGLLSIASAGSALYYNLPSWTPMNPSGMMLLFTFFSLGLAMYYLWELLRLLGP